MNTFEINAENKTIGRVATQAAMALMGKNSPAYKSNVAPEVSVKIINANSAKITNQRKKGKVYTSYTGHPGGLRHETLEKKLARKGIQEVFQKAVYGMLPNNRLRKIYMKNLTITE
jgi:large subunit ribosomal protein L13